MFSFHKPKIYRSNLGCCICKAKSSSSRFTDSNKYENEFARCFRIEEKRCGEICNACVLLVKRWKKLSPENRLTKHWHHVVDARAGPGTKLTNIRRIGSSSSSLNSSSASSSSPSSSSSSSSAGPATASSHQRHARSDLLPLASNQSANSGATNQQQQQQQSSSSGAAPRRAGSFSSNKARAVDTNVSTFTFGETSRRNYMALEATYFGASSSSLNRPQSALNSSAFESVIKRFRQRQQQQQIEANRRQQKRAQRLQRRQQLTSATPETGAAADRRQLPVQLSETDSEEKRFLSPSEQHHHHHHNGLQPQKRVKRPSESIGSLTVDGFRITNLLDGFVWRKERTCCGIIFRGPHNEAAIFPKLLRPCQCATKRALTSTMKRRQQQQQVSELAAQQQGARELSPPPRTTKSGSVSSCDSNTSGTGSMDCPQVDCAQVANSRLQQRRRVLQRKSTELRLRPSTTATSAARLPTPAASQSANQKQELRSPGLNSSSSEETASSSGASMSHLMLMDEAELENGLVCGMELGEDLDSSTDGSSGSLSSSAASDNLAATEPCRRTAKKSSNSAVGAAS